MLDILWIIWCLLITAVVAWNEGAKYERRKVNKSTYKRRRFLKHLEDAPMRSTWD